MAAGSIAAGLIDGYVRGLGLRRQMEREDEEREERKAERAWRAEQQGRQRQDWADEDQVRSALKTVKRDVSSYGPNPEDSELYGPQAGGLQRVSRSQRDILADSAKAVAGIGGVKGAQLGLQFQQGVDQLDEVQRQRRRNDLADERQRRLDAENAIDIAARRAREKLADSQARVQHGLRQARVLIGSARGDPARLTQAMKLMQSFYEDVPDGRKLVIDSRGAGVIGSDGKWVHKPVPITQENVEAALEYAERYADPEGYAARKKLDTEAQYRAALAKEAERANTHNENVLRAQVIGGYYNQRPGSTAAKIEKMDDGTIAAFSNSGMPIHNVLADGQVVTPGITNTAVRKAEVDAKRHGVTAVVGTKAGRSVIAFQGRDGEYYDTAAEAAKAKPKSSR